jgi:hypothetical protein
MVYLTFSVQPFKCQVLAAAGLVCSSNAQCRTVFCLVDIMGVYLVGVHLMGEILSHFSVKDYDAVTLSVPEAVQHCIIG